jgi:hypothetical protein
MKKTLTRAALLWAVALSSHGAILTYTALNGVGGFLPAVGGSATYTEDFSAGAVYSNFQFLGGSGNTGLNRGVYGGQVTDQVDAQVGTVCPCPVQTTIISLNSGNMFGFAANWDLGAFGAGSNVIISIRRASDSAILTVGTISDFTSGYFFGWTSDEAFDQVILSGGNAVAQSAPSSWESFTFDNVLLENTSNGGGGGGGGGVPEPSTFGLMGVAMIGLGVLRKFRS